VGVRVGWILLVAACAHGAPPAPGPTCADAAAHVLGLVGEHRPRAGKIRDAFARRCVADGWGEAVRGCIVATVALSAPRHCKAMLTADKRGKLDHELAVIARTPASAWAPQVCSDYRALVGTLGGCAGIPRAARDALEQTYRTLVDAWAAGQFDTGQLETQCGEMTTALRRAMVATCGM